MKKVALVTLLLVVITTTGEETRASLTLLGDTYSGEAYAKAEPVYRPTSKKLKASFTDLSPLLKHTDHIIANLECSLSGSHRIPISKSKPLVHWANELLLQLLRDHRITNVSLANNHAMDYGRKGLKATLSTLKTGGFQAFGAGRDEAAGAAPLILTVGTGNATRQLVIIGGFNYQKKYQKIYNYYAKGSKGGVNLLTESLAARQVHAARRRYPKSIIITFPHWGDNYTWRSASQKIIAHAMIDAGADIVVGHGAHMVQEIEIYKKRPIIYSLGNFFFMSPGRYGKLKVPHYSFVARVYVDDTLPHIRLYPISCDNRVVAYRPRPVSTAEMIDLTRHLKKRCSNAMALTKTLRDDMGDYFRVPLTLRRQPFSTRR